MQDAARLTVRQVGLPHMDAQHARLLEVLDRLETLAGTPNEFAAIVEAVEALFSYAQIHLADEEQMLREAGYPEFATHVGKHRRFVEAILNLMTRLENGEDIYADLVRSIRTWLVEHINVDDMDYAAFLANASLVERS